jgi:prophage regulatory protein
MKMIELPQTIGKTTMSKSMIYALVKEGKFPAPVKIGDRKIGWVEAEVDAWLEARVKASRENAAAAAA